MANAVTAMAAEYWSKRMQIVREKTTIFRKLANYEERAVLKNGDIVHRPYRSGMHVQTYSKGTAVTVQDISATDEYLTVDQAKIVPFYVDDIDQIQNKWDTVNKFADDAGKDLYSYIDGQFLGEYANATSDIDDGDVGGTAGVSAVLSTSNIAKFFAAANKKLDQLNIDRAGRWACISPTVYQILIEKLDGKDSALGDSTGMNGHVGKYMGFDLYLSNNVGFTAKWTPANNPTAADYITINGVTMTFVASPASAGDVDIEIDTATTLVSLTACINNNGTGDGTDYVTLSGASLDALQGCVATANTTYLGITFKGGGECAVAASESADLWSVETVHQLFGQGKAIDLVIQKEPKVEFRMVEDKLGQNVLPWTLYGIKTFAEGAAALVDGKVNSSSW